MKNQIKLLLILLALTFVGCKKDALAPDKITGEKYVHENEIDCPGVLNPFKIIGHYFSDVDQAYRYYVVSNNGVYFNIPSSSLHKTKEVYTWENGRSFMPIKIDNFKKVYKFVRTDTNGVSLRDTLDWTQLPK